MNLEDRVMGGGEAATALAFALTVRYIPSTHTHHVSGPVSLRARVYSATANPNGPSRGGATLP